VEARGDERTRKATDGERAALIAKGIEGKRLTYLSFPKIISARSDDAVRTGLV
jgi:hypothetical protein